MIPWNKVICKLNVVLLSILSMEMSLKLSLSLSWNQIASCFIVKSASVLLEVNSQHFILLFHVCCELEVCSWLKRAHSALWANALWQVADPGTGSSLSWASHTQLRTMLLYKKLFQKWSLENTSKFLSVWELQWDSFLTCFFVPKIWKKNKLCKTVES